MQTRSKVSGGSEPLKKGNRGGQTAVRTPKILEFSACKAQDNQHEIKIAFFKRDKGVPPPQPESLPYVRLKILLTKQFLLTLFKNLLDVLMGYVAQRTTNTVFSFPSHASRSLLALRARAPQKYLLCWLPNKVFIWEIQCQIKEWHKFLV